MDQFVALSFPDQAKMDEATRAVRRFHSEVADRLYASAVVTRAADGKLSVQEITKAGHGGTIIAALIGALAGLPAGPVAAAVMAAGGAAIGDAADLTVQDHFTEFANCIAEKVTPGGAVIVSEVAEDSAPSFRTTLERAGGTAMRLPPSQHKLETT